MSAQNEAAAAATTEETSAKSPESETESTVAAKSVLDEPTTGKGKGKSKAKSKAKGKSKVSEETSSGVKGRKPMFEGETLTSVLNLLREHQNASAVRRILVGITKEARDARVAAGLSKDPYEVTVVTLLNYANNNNIDLKKASQLEPELAKRVATCLRKYGLTMTQRILAARTSGHGCDAEEKQLARLREEAGFSEPVDMPLSRLNTVAAKHGVVFGKGRRPTMLIAVPAAAE